MRGHLCSPDFACFSAVVSAFFRFCQKHRRPLGSWQLRSGLAKTLRSFFSRYSCQVSGPWTWFPESDASIHMSLLPASRWFANNCKALQHSLRELWRRHLFGKWASSSRIDSRLAGNVPYSEVRCAAARSLALKSLDTTAVQVGANVSPAKLRVMMRDPRPRRSKRKTPAPVFICPFCSQEGADLQHVVWSCFQRRWEDGSRPPLCPDCPLQRCLGWPRRKPPDAYDIQVLTWQAFCRKRILQERWC